MAGDYHRGPFGLGDRRRIWFVSLDRALPDNGFLMSRRGAGSALLAALALASCDSSQAPPPPVIVVAPDPPPAPAPAPIGVADEAMPPPRERMEVSDLPASSSIIPLFGPCHPGWDGHPPAEWIFPDTANTSSTENLYFGSWEYDPIVYAPAIVVWQPTSEAQWVRLVWMPTNIADGYGTWQQVDILQGARDANGWGPRSWRPDLTSFMQERRAARKDIYIGVQCKGDGNAAMMMWKSNVHIVHDRPKVAA